jgi:hypothetical protein
MEEVFILVAVLVYWAFRSLAGGQRRQGRGPGPDDPYASGPLSEGGLTDQIEDAQQRAFKALDRPAATEGQREVSFDRPGVLRQAERPSRRRQEAYEAIAQLLDPAAASRTARPRTREPEIREARPPDRPRPEKLRAARGSAAEGPAPEAGPPVSARPRRTGERRTRKRAEAALRRIESQPLLKRAILYSEIFGRPKGL